MSCPRCGTENPVGAKFCLECGETLTAPAPVARREERKVVSVLFADLVGFTAQAERLDPEEVRAVLQPYHALVRAELEHFGGTVEKFIGDAVMALFGAPTAHEDDPERAVRAALAVRDSLAADGRFHVRIGITTGSAIVAVEARPEAGEGMAAGDVVNTAARLQAAAPVDGILVDEATHRATSRAIEYHDHEPITAKGKAEPITVHEAVAARARFGVDVRQVGAAPLVGRIREVELLNAALDRARGEREPQLVTLVGVPGIGKSRLVWELFRAIDAGTELTAWRSGRSLPYGEGISFWALGEIVKAEAGILETDSLADVEAKLARAVDAVGPEPAEAEWLGSHLRPLIGLEADADLRGGRRGEAFAAWRRYLEALAERRPIVLVFEDLHWADEGLLDFIDHLVDWATGVPLLIVATARPELLARRPNWGGGKPNAATVSLGPLTDSDTSALVAALVELAVLPAQMRDAVVERAAGNPLYAEEFARLVAESGRLDDLPDTVQGMIAARLDGLTREEKALLQDAAVVGKVFWSGALGHLAGRDRAEVEATLHGLERREFVRRDRRSSVAGETEYAFRHILVRDVAYGQIPRAERAERHALAAEWIDSLGRSADHAELLAEHYLAAIDLARAAGRSPDAYAARAREALRDAGERASSLHAAAGAARYFAAALELTGAGDSDRPVLLFEYGRALVISAQAGGEVLAEAEIGLRAAGDLERAAEAAVLQAELAWFAGDGAETAGHLARAAELVDRLADSPSKAYVLSDLSRYHMLAGRYPEAIEVGRRAIALAEALGLDEIRAHALNNVGTARVNLDDRDGFRELEMAVEIARARNSPEVARALNNLASTLSGVGEVERADKLWREAHALARELGNVSVERFTRPIILWQDYHDGDWDEVERSLDAFLEEVESGGGHTQESVTRTARSRIRFARGDAVGAIDDANRAVAAGRRAGDPQAVLPALVELGRLLVETGRGAEAQAIFDEVLSHPDLDEQLDAESAMAVVDLGRAADLLAAVTAMPATPWRDLFRAIAMGRLAEAVERSEKLRGGPPTAYLRLRLADELARGGRPAEAREVLDRAVAFWRSVGATHYLGVADSIAARIEGAPVESP